MSNREILAHVESEEPFDRFTAEKARIVSDPQAMLKAPEKVSILVANARRKPFGNGGDAGTDVARHFARHEDTCDRKVTSRPSPNTNETILSLGSDLDGDLLVVGVSAHQRWRHFMVGGTTQEVFEKRTVPVLVSQ